MSQGRRYKDRTHQRVYDRAMAALERDLEAVLQGGAAWAQAARRGYLGQPNRWRGTVVSPAYSAGRDFSLNPR